MATRVGVDVGGTFTDLIFYDEASGEVRVAKEPTTPAAPEEGVIAAVENAIPGQLLRSAAFFLHGTTVGLNALLEKQGAVLGMLCTRGFRDVIEVRRGDRAEMYNLVWSPPAPLVPRWLRLPVSERVRADGLVHAPLDEEDVIRAVEVFNAEGVTAVAVTFLHSYANPVHELAAEEALRRFGFTGEISLSHRISGEYREYERSCTTIVDAYVRPRVATYLRRLAEALAAQGFAGQCLLTRSGGGAMTFADGEEGPVETILSGPVAGAQGAAQLARTLGLPEVITADVGGTSFDTCLIADGRPELMYEGSVIGLPLQIPWVDVRSIGAGGGSIAYVDAGGLLRVGPRSAGADPGPASYARGGTEPTVTDAALALGLLGDGQLAGGIHLDLDRAQRALQGVADAAGLARDEVAQGVLRIATARMADAIREITIERGRDPRGAALLAFGGAGPLLGTMLARELDVRTVVVPPYAGNFSAWGLLGSDVTQTSARTRITRLSPEGLRQAGEVLAELFEELAGRASIQLERVATTKVAALEMRYVGQEHTLSVPVTLDDVGAGIVEDEIALREAFDRHYQRVFAHALEEPVEIVHVRAAVEAPLPKVAQKRIDAIPADEHPGSWRTYSFDQNEWLQFDLYQRESIPVGTVIDGPAIIFEPTATTYVDAGFAAEVDPSGSLTLNAKATRAEDQAPHANRQDDLPRRSSGDQDRDRVRSTSGEDQAQRATSDSPTSDELVVVRTPPRSRDTLGSDVDPVTTEVIRNALNSAAEQMKRGLVRTAFSLLMYEVLDFACAIYDRQMRLLAQAPTFPIFMGTLSFCVEAGVAAVGGEDALESGDVILYNIPYGTGSHMQDAALIMPIYFEDQLIAYAAVKAHWLDIGGKDPYSTDTVDVHQEGTIYPGIKLYKRGELVGDIYRIILANTRIPKMVAGDINAQIVGLRAGVAGVTRLVERHGLDVFGSACERMFDHGEALIREYFKRLPDGVYVASGEIDSDGISDETIPFEVRVEVADSNVRVDYSSAPTARPGPMNCPLPSTVSATRVAISMLAGAGESPNDGQFRPLEVVVRPGSMFHPLPPSPCFLYAWPAFQAIEVIYKAIAQAMPSAVPASSGGDIVGIVWWGVRRSTGEPWAEGGPNPIGHGAWTGGDGASSLIHIGQACSRISPVEVLENRYPWLLRRVELAPDSCGAGRYRGGLGLNMDFEMLDDSWLTSVLDRTKNRPWGLAGGTKARANSVAAILPDGTRKEFGKITRFLLPRGGVLELRTAGGGGYGEPREREPEAIEQDLRAGYITHEHATEHYGRASLSATTDAAATTAPVQPWPFPA